MAEEYPCKLPGFRIGASYSPQDLVSQNDLSSGPPIFRLRSSDGWLAYRGSFSFSALENQVFRSWHKNVVKSGSKSFNIELMVDGFDGTKNTVTHECYFLGVPNYSQNGTRWNVSVSLIAINPQYLDECDTESLFSIFNGFESPQNALDLIDEALVILDDRWAV